MKGAKKARARKARVFGALRYLGAYRQSPGFWESLRRETSLCTPERAAVALRGVGYHRPLGGVSVLFSTDDVRRVFSDDCWSERRADGSLYPTRVYSGTVQWQFSGYEECFLHRNATPVAIVVDPSSVTRVDINSVRVFADRIGVRFICESDYSRREDLMKKALRERRDFMR